MSTTIHGFLERNARKYPDQLALITAAVRLTYEELNQRCNQLARYWQGQGIKQGDRIAILSSNSENFIYAYFSLMKLGAIPMPINIRLTSKELLTILRNVNAVGIVYEQELMETIRTLETEYSLTYLFGIHDSVLASSSYSSDDLNLPIDSKDVCEILFTSGTTGIPKGVLFNHERILAIASAITYEFNITHQDRMLTLMPMTHSAPLNTFLMSGLYAGCTHIISSFTPKELLRWIDQEKATFMFAAPVAYMMVATDPEIYKYDLSSMRVFAYGGGPLPLASYERVKQVFQNENFYQVYGLTEAGPNGSLLQPKEHLTKAGSIGKQPTINMEFRIVRADGSDTSPHEYGEIIMTGDSLMLGYDQNPEETRNTIRNGWLYTGDIAYRDEDGYIYIVDRKKDVIISGGVNIYPREIEEVLAKHPFVVESCVIGVPHEVWGETVKAVIVCKENVEESTLHDFVSDYLADYKRPRLYSFVKQLPRNASGKVLKHVVKEM